MLLLTGEKRELAGAFFASLTKCRKYKYVCAETEIVIPVCRVFEFIHSEAAVGFLKFCSVPMTNNICFCEIFHVKYNI